MSDSAERRYSDDEIRWILHEASKSERVPSGSSRKLDESTGPHDGLTLREVLEIAREVDMDPQAVVRAARDLPAPRAMHASGGFRGPFVRVIEMEFQTPRSLGERELRDVALEAERVLDTRGELRMSPDAVEWTDRESRLTLRLVRDGGGVRVCVRADQSGDLLGGLVVLGAAGLIGSGVVLFTIPAGMLALPLIAGATAGAIWLHAVGRTATTRERLRELLNRLEDVIRLAP